MSISNPDFYAQYGLINVRQAMKRPFDQAFPAWAGRHAPQAKPLPQLRSRVVTETALWTGYPTTDGEQVAKRRRGEGVNPVPLVAPTPFMPQSAPMLLTRPPATAPQPAPGEVTELYAIPGVTDADLFQCVQLLGLDKDGGMQFLKAIAKRNGDYWNPITEPLDLSKRAIKLLDSMSTGIEGGILTMPTALEAKLVGSVANFIRKTHYSLRKSHPPGAWQIQEAILRLFNGNPAALKTIQRHGLFDDNDFCRIVGGKNRLEFLNWCSEKHIQLSDDELGGLLELSKKQFRENYQSVYDRLQSLAGNKGARHEDRFAT